MLLLLVHHESIGYLRTYVLYAVHADHRRHRAGKAFPPASTWRSLWCFVLWLQVAG